MTTRKTTNRGQTHQQWSTGAKDVGQLAPGSLNARMSKMQKEAREESGKVQKRVQVESNKLAKEAEDEATETIEKQKRNYPKTRARPMPKDKEAIEKKKLWEEAQIKELTRKVMEGNLADVREYEEQLGQLLDKVREILLSFPERYSLYYTDSDPEKHEAQVAAIRRLVSEGAEELEM